MGLDFEVNVNFVSEQSVIDTYVKLETWKLIPNHEFFYFISKYSIRSAIIAKTTEISTAEMYFSDLTFRLISIFCDNSKK